MRLFIAVELPPEAKLEAERVSKEFFEIKSARFVRPENMHVTMKFLGEVSEDAAQEVKKALQALKINPFKVKLSGLGVFPDEKEPRVVWVGVEPHMLLDQLKRVLDRNLPKYTDDKPFSGHITVARINDPRPDEKQKITDKVKSLEVDPKEFEVKRVALIKSTLTPKGPVYEEMI